MPDISSLLTEVQTAKKNFNNVARAIKSKEIPLYELLANMDTNKDKSLTVDEILENVLEDNKFKINATSAVKSLFSSKENKIDPKLSVEEKAKQLGIDIDSIKKQLNSQIGEKGIDLNNLTDALSKFCGVDFKMVSEQAQKFGFKFDITKLSIADIKNLLDDIETILKDPKVQCTIMFGSAAYSSYKNNSKLATVTNGYLAYTSFVSANISNDTAAKYTEKANQTIADNVGRKVEETLGDNFASRAISSTTNFIVKQAADTVTGVTGNKVKRGLQSAWDFITDIF